MTSRPLGVGVSDLLPDVNRIPQPKGGRGTFQFCSGFDARRN